MKDDLCNLCTSAMEKKNLKTNQIMCIFLEALN